MALDRGRCRWLGAKASFCEDAVWNAEGGKGNKSFEMCSG